MPAGVYVNHLGAVYMWITPQIFEKLDFFSFFCAFRNNEWVSVSFPSAYNYSTRIKQNYDDMVFRILTNKHLIQCLPGTLCPGMHLLDLETDHLIPSSAEIKNAWGFISTFQCLFIKCCLSTWIILPYLNFFWQIYSLPKFSSMQ